MKLARSNTAHVTLRQIFNRRLSLLLLTFSVVMSSFIILVYQKQTEQLNRTAMSSSLAHLLPRLNHQQDTWQNDAGHIFSVIVWSGLLNLSEPQRNEKLRAFFTAQSDSMEFEGVVIRDDNTGKLIFDFWNNNQRIDFQSALRDDQPYWFDRPHAVLYSKIQHQLRGSARHLSIFLFNAWDSATLKHLDLADSTSLISLGDQPLLSSAGNLALADWPPSTQPYSEPLIKGIQYQEGRVIWNEMQSPDGQRTPIYLNSRNPKQNQLPILLVLFASIGITLLFGAVLFITFGQWLRRLGVRLDSMAKAALRFQSDPTAGVSADTRQLLDTAADKQDDQISMVTQELGNLMSSAAQRDEEQRTYLQTLNLLQDAVIEFTPDMRLLRATDAWKTLTGVNDIAACSINSCIHPEDSASLQEQINALTYQQKEQINTRFRLLRQNDADAQYWVEGRFSAVKLNDKIVSIRGVVRDITSSYHQERQISHMALHDALTDLPNRVLLEDRMAMAISRASRSGQRVALGFIDIDHFKQVNDNFGHKIGDLMLKQVTKKLESALRGTDTLSRWGGDEFVVLCPDLKTLEDTTEIAQKLSSVASEGITIDGTNLPFTFSGGFAVYPDDASNSEMLLSQADRAMFYAKAQGRNNIQFFNSIAGKETGRQSFYIQSRLMQAIHSDQIQCWLQPLVSSRTGLVIGAEALARWHEPEQGWIPPSVFIPMAESLGMIDKVGQTVWLQALHALTLLPATHRLSVNLSKRQLFSNTIVQQLLDDVERANIEPGRIMLEITESIALSDVAYARERIVELDARGFGISIDDFGVGYSSLSQLHEIPADELKLDMSFVKRIHEKSGMSMATAIISIAKSLDLECVAEGVEDAHTAQLLSSMGVEVLQGYYFAKPMPIDDYLVWLTTYKPVISSI